MRVAALSILIHLLNVLAAWCAANAVAAPLSFAQALFLVLPVILVSAVPISIAGWGVRESAMVTAFAYAGLGDGDGLIVSLLFGAGNFVVGALGGLIWVGVMWIISGMLSGNDQLYRQTQFERRGTRCHR